MKKLLFLIGVFTSSFCISQNQIIQNGAVWDGEDFVIRDVYISNGFFVEEKPVKIDTIIEADQHYIIPPFGDYHTHAFDGDYAITMDSIYLSKGIFFSQDLGNDPIGRRKNQLFFSKKETIDVRFANGILTSNYGHPIEGYERMALGINWPKNQAQKDSIRESRLFKNRYYYVIDRLEEVEKTLNQLISTQPDVLKIVLWNASEYEESETYPIFNKGLNPTLLDRIKELSDAFKIPIIAHIDTEYDLSKALVSGIKNFAHAPLYTYGNDGVVGNDFPRLSKKTIDILQSNDSVVINPTLYRTYTNLRYLPKEYQPNETEQQLLRKFHKQLLVDLRDSGVQIVAGADMWGINSIDEIYYYADLEVFTPKELLTMLIETSKKIFPNRNIGAIKKGYEANLLILNTNPLKDIKNLNTIELRIKNGVILR